MSVAPPARKPNPVKKWVRTRILEKTLWNLPKSDKILDLGTGYGFYLSINPNAWGVDGDPVSIELLEKQGLKVKFCDILKRLPFDNDEFEYVIAHDVLEHFAYEELVIIFNEVHRILKPNGCFLVFVPNRKGYDSGLRTNAGHKLYVTATEIESLRKNLFTLKQNYPEPFPRSFGKYFAHNKEVFELIKC